MERRRSALSGLWSLHWRLEHSSWSQNQNRRWATVAKSVYVAPWAQASHMIRKYYIFDIVTLRLRRDVAPPLPLLLTNF
eukprot:scaffold13785_cov93-Isochrysis_galbana.AAC.2